MNQLLRFSYFDELCSAMNLCAAQTNSIFMGQAVACEGTAMRRTLVDIPSHKLLELPVFEDQQLGIAIGMSLNGFLPICLYPRFNFLLLAVNQLVNHLDKLPLYSNYKPKVIIRTAIATDQPLDPGPQHLGDFTDAFKSMLTTVNVVRLDSQEQIIPEYENAIERDCSSLIVEYMGKY